MLLLSVASPFSRENGDNDAVVTQVVKNVRDLLHTEAVNQTMGKIHLVLFQLGFPPPYMDAERLAISILAGFLTLVMYFILFGKRHRDRRRMLQDELLEASERMVQLEEKLAELDDSTLTDAGGSHKSSRDIRIWMDGAFDMMHYGHMNAFRQGKALGTYLVVGVNDDASITTCKGAPPVMNDLERVTAVEGCKFVNEVERHCPYVMNEAYLHEMIEKHQLDFVVHGDDPCLVDGLDVYATAKALGKYRSIPRTEGVSTSDILGRMLLLNKSHHSPTVNPGSPTNTNTQLSSKIKTPVRDTQRHRPSRFLTTNRMLRLFSAGNRDPKPLDRVVYVDGSFDLFHSGHIELLAEARALGQYLIVGVHNDAVVNEHRGLNYPIMNLHERVLSVLGCRYVDDVLIDAPWDITKEMVASLNLALVVHGSHPKAMGKSYAVPKELGIFHHVESPSTLDVQDIVARINGNRERFEAKFKAKMGSEQEYYDERYGLKRESS